MDKMHQEYDQYYIVNCDLASRKHILRYSWSTYGITDNNLTKLINIHILTTLYKSPFML